MEISAENVEGFFLWNPFEKKYFFRIYEENPESFTDYDIVADDIEVKLLSSFNSLYKSEKCNKLDYSSKLLGKS